MEFEAGDLVRLKSGGPLMTLEELGDKESVCVWFTVAGEFNRRHIANVNLVPAQAPAAAKPSHGRR